jgi:hypothetical protein
MLMQNASEQVKNLHAENQRSVHNNGYGHNPDSNVPPMLRQPLFGTPVKGSKNMYKHMQNVTLAKNASYSKPTG